MMNVRTSFYNEQEDWPVTVELKHRMEAVIYRTLDREGYDRSCEVSVAFVEEAKIRALNAEYRGRDSVTDVLSFADGTPAPDTGVILLGDVEICAKRAVEQAEQYGHSVEREFCFLSAHSTLHLLGYDHQTELDEKIMRAKQTEILESLGITQ